MLSEKSEKRSTAETLVALAHEMYTFVITTDGEFLAVPRVGPKVTKMLRNGPGSVQKDLARTYHRLFGRVPTEKAIRDALGVLEGEAACYEPETAFTRVADANNCLYIDLGDASGEAIEVGPDGWQVISNPPVIFRRSPLTAALPMPERGGSIDQFFDYAPVAERDRALLLGFIISAFFANIPHPILNIVGEQGSGKSGLCRRIVSVTDPSRVSARKPPRDIDGWVTACLGSWVINLDNMSAIPEWMSDSFCRVSTGEGDVRRRLYSDSDLVVFHFRRVLILNGISFTDLREDLADRTIQIELPVLVAEERKTETELDEKWRIEYPFVFGALLDLLSKVLHLLPSIKLQESPRMADFARVQAAIDQILLTSGLSQMLESAKSRSVTAFDNDPVLQRLGACIRESWEGTASDLLTQVGPPIDAVFPRDWPRDAREMTSILKRRAPILRQAGWEVDDLGSNNKNHTKRWRISPPTLDSTDRRSGASMAGTDSFPRSLISDGRPDKEVGIPLAILADTQSEFEGIAGVSK